MVEHNVITDPEIHEPKGVSTAVANTVYVADGAASGDWTKIYPTNYVFVASASDFPTAVSDVITLAADTVYLVTGEVDIGNDRIVMSNNTVLMGTNQDYDKVTSTTTGNLITVVDITCRFIQIGLSCSAGTLLSVDGTGVESFDLIRVSAVCDTIGTIDNLSNVDIFRCGFDAATSGLLMTGAHDRFEVGSSTFDVAATNATCIDLGTATFNDIHLYHIDFVNPTGTGYGLDVAAAGANFNAGKEGTVSFCTFSNPSNGSNYVEGDDRWIMTFSPGIAPSTPKASGYVDGNGNANTFGGGIDVPEVVNFGTSFVADRQDKFTVSNAGRFTFTGLRDVTVVATATTRVTMSGGASRVRNLTFAKNGTNIPASIASKSLDGTNEATMTCIAIITLATNDYIELFIEAETATTSTTVDTASIVVVESL